MVSKRVVTGLLLFFVAFSLLLMTAWLAVVGRGVTQDLEVVLLLSQSGNGPSLQTLLPRSEWQDLQKHPMSMRPRLQQQYIGKVMDALGPLPTTSPILPLFAATLFILLGTYLYLDGRLVQAEHDNRELQNRLLTVNMVALASGQDVSFDTVLKLTLQEMGLGLHANRVLLIERQEDGQAFIRSSYPDGDHEVIPQGWLYPHVSAVGKAFTLGEVVVGQSATNQLRQSYVLPLWPHQPDRTYLVAPVFVGPTETYVLAATFATGQTFNASGRELFTFLASHIGNLLETIHLRQESQRLTLVEEIARLKSELLANVSHELRTPLGLIKGASSTLRLNPVKLSTEIISDFIDIIDDEADRLQDLIYKLLDMSEIEGVGLTVHKKRSRVSEVVEIAVERARQWVNGQHLEVAVPEIFVCMDAERIGQVIINFIENACKYGPPHGVIFIGAEEMSEDILFYVEDQGLGVAQEDAEMVFERFYRGKHVSELRGTGLGLAIAKRIVQAHGGVIGVQKSRFWFRLPKGDASCGKNMG